MSAVEIVAYNKGCLDRNLNISLQSSEMQQREAGTCNPALTLEFHKQFLCLPGCGDGSNCAAQRGRTRNLLHVAGIF